MATVANRLTICDGIPDTVGWASIKHMILLMSELLGSDVVKLPESGPGKLRKAFHYFIKGRERGEKNNSNLLLITTTLGTVNNFLSLNSLATNNYNKIAIWVIDSSYTDYIPRLASTRFFDHLFITSGNDIEFYEKKTKINTSFLGYGSDVLNLGSLNGDRKTDILRVGRQPNRYDNDEINESKFNALHLNYQGRPDFNVTYEELLRNYYAQSKYVLAHSNLADESKHTHAYKEYITTRWTDALACGCTIIGEQPKSDYAYKKDIWPKAVIDIDSSDRCVDGSDLIKKITEWTPNKAKYNYMMALKKLDWRWRFKELTDFFDLKSNKLDKELREIEKILHLFES